MALFNILVDIAAKTASFESGMKRVENQLDHFGETVRKAFEFAGVGLGLHELVSKFDEFVEKAENTKHAAEKTGLLVEQLSRLEFAANQANVSSESLTSGIEKFAKTAALAEAGGKKQAEAFSAIGVSVTDSSGHIKSMDDLLKQVADKFASYRDSVEKTALAQILFGKAGADLIPVLNLGSEGIAELEKRSDELGNTISAKTAEAADKFNSKLKDLHGITNGLWQTIAANLLPTLTDLVGGFNKSAGGAEKLQKVADGVAASVKLIASATLVIGGAFKAIGEFEGGLFAAQDAFIHGNFKQSFEILKATTSDLGKNLSSTAASVGGLWDDTGKKLEDLADTADKNKGKIAAPIVGAYDAASELLDALAQLDKKSRETVASTGDQIAREGAASASKYLEKIPAYAQHAWDRIDAITQAGAANIQGDFENFLFDPAAKGFKGLETDFLNSVRRMIAQAASADIFKALFGSDKSGNSGLGGILGSIAGGLFGSSGGDANINSDWGQQADSSILAGFATGGSFTVGGKGGIDQNVVAFKASRGENVSITTPGQSSGGTAIHYAPTFNVGGGASRQDVVSAAEQARKQAVADMTRLIRGGAFA
jgi:hypothetical protein